jgi:hypothetical protein
MELQRPGAGAKSQVNTKHFKNGVAELVLEAWLNGDSAQTIHP